MQPLANNYLNYFKKNQTKYNLSLFFNTKTKLVSISKRIPSKKMFNNKYPYKSSMSETMKKSFYNLSIEIREGRISRKEAIKIVNSEKKLPLKQITLFCKYLNISRKRFFNIAEKFRNKKIWKLNNKNKWYLKNFLIKNYKW